MSRILFSAAQRQDPSFRAKREISLFLLSLFFYFATSLLPASSFAQGPATGTPPFGSFGGGPDVINLGNLNVHLDFAIARKPGRGLNFNYDLTYDSSVWYPAGSSGTQSWQPVSWWANPTLGWQGLSSAQPGGIAYTETIGYSDPHSSCSVTQYWYSNFSYWDNSGTQHAFPYSLQGEWLDGSGIGGCPPTGPQPAAPWTGTATDGSGYTLSITPSQTYQTYPPTLSATLTDKNGTIVPAAMTGQTAPSSWFNSDRNGNEITMSNGVYTDTLGTTALTVFGLPPNNTTTTLSYTAPSGATATYTVRYTAYTVQTNFNCSGISEYGPTSNYLVSEIDLPDDNPNGTRDRYTFTYEGTLGHTGNVTGRLVSVTIPTGGTITYAYSGGGTGVNGVTCADGSAATLTRTTPDGTWTYARTQVSGSHWQTQITTPPDPLNQSSAADVTVIDFQKDAGATNNFYETQRAAYQGSSSGTLLLTTSTCYNGSAAPCTSTTVTSPITQTSVIPTLPGAKNLQSKQVTSYNTYGQVTEVDSYGYGSGAPSSTALSKTLTSYDTLQGNGTLSLPATVTIEDGSGNIRAKTTLTYDQGSVSPSSGTPQHLAISGSRGNATTIATLVQGSTTLNKTVTYFDTGNPNTSTDVNGGVTTYSYTSGAASCYNSFPTSITEAITTLSTSMTWNCTGGVQLTAVDENTQTTTTTYNDPYFWRPASVADPTGASVSFCYGMLSSGTCSPSPNQTESTVTFNSGNSIVDTLTTLDALARVHVQQTRQGPSSPNFDSIETDYDAFGRPNRVTVPYQGTEGQTNSSAPATTTVYDALNRTYQTTDGGGGSVSYSHSNNDALLTVGPAPSGENTKRRQLEYDALGRLTSVCELTTGSQSGACGQNTAQTGYWTEYTFDPLGNLTGVTQNAQPNGTTQSRSYSFDGLSRLTSETNAESGTTSYTYDADTTCSYGSSGDLIKHVDALGNTSCFTYDALHRSLSVTYPSGSYASVTPSKYFVYDAATVNSVPMANVKARLAEAYTGSSSAKITDIGFSYTMRGEASDLYELTPHSSPSYYHISAQYWANGGISQLGNNIVSFPNILYAVDGEGRINSVTANDGQNVPLVTGVNYNNASLPTQVTFATGDTDIFAYDPNTMRTTQYQFNINGQSSTGALTWNANNSLQKLVITDAFNSSDNQTCNYAHDDLARIASANCGTPASQTFTYDPFGNISKSGSPYTFQPTYNAATNRFTSIPGASVSYDANGNVLTDGSHTYAWDADGNSISLDSVGLTFDALDRMVEQNRSGTYTEIVYSPGGAKLALMSGSGGQTLQKAFVPLPGQATAVYTSSGLDHYRHSDWLGSARLTSSPTRTVLSTSAYAPFGESYAQSGTADLSFTGMNQDTTSGDSDFLYREYSTQGRWPSPDPSGINAVDPTNPQSWNRYAYVLNNPLPLVDPEGLDCAYGGSYVNGAIGQYSASSGASCSSLGGMVCIVDGVQTPCQSAFSLISAGAAAVCPDNDCTNWSLKTSVDGNSTFIATFRSFWLAQQNMLGGCIGLNCVLSYNSSAVPAQDVEVGMDLWHNTPECPNCANIWNGAQHAVYVEMAVTSPNYAAMAAIPIWDSLPAWFTDAFNGINNNPLLRVGPGYDEEGNLIWRIASGGRWGKGGPPLPWHWHLP